MAICAGIKRIFYAETSIFTQDLDDAKATALIKSVIADAKAKNKVGTGEVLNVHGETWTLDESESAPQGYKNQLTGQTYRFDKPAAGDITPSFSIGQYDYQTKADLMGGEVIKSTSGSKPIGWKRGVKDKINKSLFCLTDDNIWFVFPSCTIDTREANTDKAIALAVKGYVQEPEVAGVHSEYNFEEAAIKALA